MQPDDFASRFDVSRETIEKLKIYEALLRKWQNAINLVAPSTLGQIWERHFADSLQLAAFMPNHMRIADLGAGAGFPGLVLAIARPDLEIHLIESDTRKAEFLKNVSRETATPVKVHNARAESVLPHIAPQIVTARAFAALKEILNLCEPLFNSAPQFVLLKGGTATDEVAQATEKYEFLPAAHPSQTDPKAQILHLKNVRARTSAT
ncbi:MAG: 16S rRNA (guanine(527)-N(7))-methyltransferase RsmG [Alphaproteobacteria bacterium]|nr:16S rRNA (guanine(527)-N(7))-methyltransferase RsmG [Alphaproteobacteria bacterium]